MSAPWPLRLPGLRRYGAQLEHARRQVVGLRNQISALRERYRENRRRFAARLHDHKSRQLAPEVLRQVLKVRHEALLASHARFEASARDADFRQRSASYAEATSIAATPLASESAVTEGVIFHVPATSVTGGALAGRILSDGWLPLHDIVAARELALGTAMLDIGANVGTTSIPRVVLGDFRYVYAAEPDPANYACLVQNVVANQLGGFVMPDRVAIGAADGDATLHRGGGISGHRLVPAPQTETDITVSCLTLDSWVKRLGVDIKAVTFVKVDTQGWESHVLEGASALLAQRHIAWQLEFSPRLLARACP